jgi:cobalt-zinc-cadmium resistance protein CzcA
MVRKLIEWAVSSPLIVILLALALALAGAYAFVFINVEAYPDPAPAIIEVVAQYPGFSAEEVERQVTIPLEVTLAGMPGLKYTRTKSLFGLSHLRNQFEYGIEFEKARQEVINRLQFTQQLPQGVNPQISPETPTGEIYRYTLSSPKNPFGRDIYTLNDTKAFQDWRLEREFKRVPRIADVSSSGGTVKRYEIHPDPNRLKRYGITLNQLQSAITNGNGNVGGDFLRQGRTALAVRGLGNIGGSRDPMEHVVGMRNPQEAANYLRDEDNRRILEIRNIVVTTFNNSPIRVDDVVEGGPLQSPVEVGKQGVVVGFQTRLGRVGRSRPLNPEGTRWLDEDDVVNCVVLLRKNYESIPALQDVEKKVKESNTTPGRMLPGVKIDTYYDRTDLINVTTHTVRHNLILGIALVTVILLMFLSNVRSALIVAINIPLALLFAFAMLFVRGKSANLLSIGAVDFGIIVDSSVIMVENIYRHLASGEYADLPLKERIIRASHEVERSLFFSTAIMVCAFIPLFTMQGPEGQIFGPMAETYAFALGGALLLAVTVAPVLCLLFFRYLRPSQDNFLVRFLKRSYLRQLARCLNHPYATLAVFGALMVATAFWVFVLPVLQKEFPKQLGDLPTLGGEFMPELEEGNLWIRGTFPLNVSLDEVAEKTRIARRIMQGYPEVESIVSMIGRPDDGTDPTGFYNLEVFVPLRPERDWPEIKEQEGFMSLFRRRRARIKKELVEEMNDELKRKIIGVDWNFSQNIRDNVMEALSGVKGDNSVKIIGPDLATLEDLAEKVKKRLDKVPGLANVFVFHIMGQSNLEFRVDPNKCKFWGVSAADINAVIRSAVGGQAFTQMIEGEKLFDITLRFPERLRGDLSAILDIPVDITNNTVTAGAQASSQQTPVSGPSMSPSGTGTQLAPPAQIGSQLNALFNAVTSTPRLRLRDLVSPVGDDGRPDPRGHYVRTGASTIYREQGKRLIAVKFSVRDRDLASAVAEAREKTRDLFNGPKHQAYRMEWSGEFQEMQEANERLLIIIPLSLGLIFVLLYLAFHSLLDALVIISNVLALSLGGVWALLMTGTAFSISAAVGFISIFGVAIMDGLLLVSYFNQMRFHGLPLKQAIMEGAEKRVRPIMMTALTAVFGLLPAALSTEIGAQTQRPLAIVVVGGMIMTLLLTRYLMPVLYLFYGGREPAADRGRIAH